MKPIDRKREQLDPLVITGLPWFRACSYVNYRIKKYREEHPDFNLYLDELEKLIKVKTTGDEFKSLINLLNNDICYVDRDIINTFIKFYNLDLSPKQTFECLCHCSELYRFINSNLY